MMSDSFLKTIFGRLTLDSFPIHEPILVATFIMVAIGGAAVLGALTYFKVWGYLWKEWFTSVDHKKIGVMYMVLGIIMLLRGFADALMMMRPAGDGVRRQRRLPARAPLRPGVHRARRHHDLLRGDALRHRSDELCRAAADRRARRVVPVPQQLQLLDDGAGAAIVMVSLFVGEFARTGWLAMAPLSGLDYSPDVGVDYYIWGLQVAGVGTLLSGVNLLATIVKMRAPGMSLMKMPIFTWSALATNTLIVAAFPILTAVLALLSLDRYLGTHFFTNTMGGNPMMYVNMIWIWGHPEVYILILPAFGVFSEVTSAFCGKRLFGYTSMVYALLVITILAYLVWLHHFFTMGSGASVNSFFGITTMIISIPTGAKIFNWLFTMYKGRIRFELPMMWTVAFMITFVIGGMTGVLLAVPPADFVLHNSLFLIAHFHNVIIGGVLFGMFAGINFWFPKAFGFKLDKFWGTISFWFWVVGFYVAFMPLYVLG